MAYRVISLKYRPQDFDELTGQSHVVLSLKGAIKSGAIGHAFLFAGPRGVGKTTTARVFAKSVNCIEGPTVTPCQKCQSCKEITTGRSIDVVEIDGASNRGIDEIRDLREGVRYAPLHSRYKIYIIDEVHMLTNEAFNALLKTLEEPPPNVIFILATTNPIKVPSTILSRCQRFVFKRLTLGELTKRLREVANRENMKITDEALHYLALRADGSVRDGESILEQLASFVEDNITKEDVFRLIGFLGSDFYHELLNKITSKDLTAVLMRLNSGIEDGADPLEIYRGLVGYLRNLLLSKAGLKEEFLELNADEVKMISQIPLTKEEVMNMVDYCLKFEETIKRSVNPRIAVELLLSQLTTMVSQKDAEAFQSETAIATADLKTGLLSALEKRSPKLAGIIHKTVVKREGSSVTIQTDTEFSRKELMSNQKTLVEILKKLVPGDLTLNILIGETPKKEIDNLAKTIKSMFDGEEVR